MPANDSPAVRHQVDRADRSPAWWHDRLCIAVVMVSLWSTHQTLPDDTFSDVLLLLVLISAAGLVYGWLTDQSDTQRNEQHHQGDTL